MFNTRLFGDSNAAYPFFQNANILPGKKSFPTREPRRLPLPIQAGRYPRNAPLDAGIRRERCGAGETASPVNPLRSCTDAADSAVQRDSSERLSLSSRPPSLASGVRSGRKRPSLFRCSVRRHRLLLLRAASLALRSRQDRDFVACSLKVDPGAMRDWRREAPPNSPHETQTTYPRRDHQEAARGGHAIGRRPECGGRVQEAGSQSTDLPPVAEGKW